MTFNLCDAGFDIDFYSASEKSENLESLFLKNPRLSPVALRSLFVPEIPITINNCQMVGQQKVGDISANAKLRGIIYSGSGQGGGHHHFDVCARCFLEPHLPCVFAFHRAAESLFDHVFGCKAEICFAHAAGDTRHILEPVRRAVGATVHIATQFAAEALLRTRLPYRKFAIAKFTDTVHCRQTGSSGQSGESYLFDAFHRESTALKRGLNPSDVLGRFDVMLSTVDRLFAGDHCRASRMRAAVSWTRQTFSPRR